MNYILEDKTPVPCHNLIEWAKWFVMNRDKKVVKQENLPGDVYVSTVFLGVDHAMIGSEEPLLFETMVFGGELDGECARCSTWEQAEVQHALTVQRIFDA